MVIRVNDLTGFTALEWSGCDKNDCQDLLVHCAHKEMLTLLYMTTTKTKLIQYNNDHSSYNKWVMLNYHQITVRRKLNLSCAVTDVNRLS